MPLRDARLLTLIPNCTKSSLHLEIKSTSKAEHVRDACGLFLFPTGWHMLKRSRRDRVRSLMNYEVRPRHDAGSEAGSLSERESRPLGVNHKSRWNSEWQEAENWFRDWEVALMWNTFSLRKCYRWEDAHSLFNGVSTKLYTVVVHTKIIRCTHRATLIHLQISTGRHHSLSFRRLKDKGAQNISFNSSYCLTRNRYLQLLTVPLVILYLGLV